MIPKLLIKNLILPLIKKELGKKELGNESKQLKEMRKEIDELKMSLKATNTKVDSMFKMKKKFK